jgi:hypothetical protein
VSNPKRSLVVSREYRAARDYCAQAVELQLKKSVSKKAAESASEHNDRNDATIVRNKEGGEHVEQRPDKPSESTYPAAL